VSAPPRKSTTWKDAKSNPETLQPKKESLKKDVGGSEHPLALKERDSSQGKGRQLKELKKHPIKRVGRFLRGHPASERDVLFQQNKE